MSNRVPGTAINYMKHLRQNRLKAGLSTSELAEIIGVSYERVLLYEGGFTPCAPRVEMIAMALKVPIVDLFEYRFSLFMGIEKEQMSLEDFSSIKEPTLKIKMMHALQYELKRMQGRERTIEEFDGDLYQFE